jgi:hypothetical protein
MWHNCNNSIGLSGNEDAEDSADYTNSLFQEARVLSLYPGRAVERMHLSEQPAYR